MTIGCVRGKKRIETILKVKANMASGYQAVKFTWRRILRDAFFFLIQTGVFYWKFCHFSMRPPSLVHLCVSWPGPIVETKGHDGGVSRGLGGIVSLDEVGFSRVGFFVVVVVAFRLRNLKGEWKERMENASGRPRVFSGKGGGHTQWINDVRVETEV